MTIVAEEGTSEQTLSEAAAFFEAEDSDAPVETVDAAKPPAPEVPTEPVPAEPEAAPEQPEGEGESDDTEVEPDAAPPAEPADAELFTVTVDGAEVKVTRDELLKGYSRQSDYSRKTMKLAEDRKAVEARDTELATERAKYAAQLASLDRMIEAQTPQEPDWHQLRATLEPAEFAARYAEWSHFKEQRKAIADEKNAAEEAVRRDEAKALETHMAEQTRQLIEAIPEWGDPEKAKTIRAKLLSAAESVGFTKADMSGVRDQRLMQLLHKAALYDEAQKAKPVIQQKIDAVKAATPGASGTVKAKAKSALRVAQDRLAKSGSIYDAAAAYEAMEG